MVKKEQYQIIKSIEFWRGGKIMLFAFIVILLAAVAMMEYARSATILRKRAEYLYTSMSLYQRRCRDGIGVEAEKDMSLSKLRKRIAFAYFVLILFHSMLYISIQTL